MSADAGGRLVRRGRALHAPHLQARAAASESGLAAALQALASAEEHSHRAVAVQTESAGSLPLLLLHVEAVLVLLEGLLSAEESRREHARVDRNTIDQARVAKLRVDQPVHGRLQAVEAVVLSADVEARVGAFRDDSKARVADNGGGVAGVGGHSCWFFGLGECMWGMDAWFRKYSARGGWTDIGSQHGALETEARSFDINPCTVLHENDYNGKR